MEEESKDDVDIQDLPSQTSFWLNVEEDKNDVFFVFVDEEGHTERIGAIRTILMGYSETFQIMLGKGDLAEKGDIKIVDSDSLTFKNFLKCVYGGSKAVIKGLTFEESKDLLNTFEKYLVLHFKPKLTKHMVEIMSMANIFVALMNPVCFEQQDLKEKIAELVSDNTDELFGNDLFLQISSNCLLFIVKLPFLNTSEINVFQAILKWGKNRVQSNEQLKEIIGEHINFIQFDKISGDDFIENVVSSGVLQPEKVVDVLKKLKNCHEATINFLDDNMVEGTFIHIINNVSGFSDVQMSKWYSLQNFLCRTEVRKDKVDDNHCNSCDYVSIFLEFKEKLLTRSSLGAREPLIDVTIIMIDSINRENVQCHFEIKHKKGSITKTGVKRFCKWCVLINRSNGYIDNDSVTFLIKITLVH